MSTANDPSVILTAALALPEQQRAALIRELIVSLDSASERAPDYEQAWAEEIDSRCAAYDRGEMTSHTVEEAMELIRQSLRTGKSP